MIKNVFVFVSVFVLGSLPVLANGLSISQEIYNYQFYGKTSYLNGYGCVDYTERNQRFIRGVPALPREDWSTKYWHPPCERGDQLWMTQNTWSNTSLTNAWTVVYKDGVPQSTNNPCLACTSTDLKIWTREMANYSGMLYNGTTNSRTASGYIRFKATGATNGTYTMTATIIAWYFPDWWPGSEFPGDAQMGYGFVPLNYVTDLVKLNGVQCDAQGKATLTWNPIATPYLQVTPTVGNSTKNRHWQYLLSLQVK